MKEKIRIFVCNKCCNTAYTTDGSIPDACTSQYWVRTSGICGGHYSEIEGADFGWVVKQEVEKRIAETVAMYGWICPRCGAVHSPFELRCNCPPPVRTWTGTPTGETEGGEG